MAFVPSFPIDLFNFLEPQNPLIDISDLHKVGLSPDVVALKIVKGSVGFIYISFRFRLIDIGIRKEGDKFFHAGYPTEHFSMLEPQNPSILISDVNIRTTDYETIKLRKGRSGEMRT